MRQLLYSVLSEVSKVMQGHTLIVHGGPRSAFCWMYRNLESYVINQIHKAVDKVSYSIYK